MHISWQAIYFIVPVISMLTFIVRNSVYLSLRENGSEIDYQQRNPNIPTSSGVSRYNSAAMPLNCMLHGYCYLNGYYNAKLWPLWLFQGLLCFSVSITCIVFLSLPQQTRNNVLAQMFSEHKNTRKKRYMHLVKTILMLSLWCYAWSP